MVCVNSSRPQTEWEFEDPTKGLKGRRDVDFPKDDYFMALAVLATSRSPFEKKVHTVRDNMQHIYISQSTGVLCI